MTPDVWPPYDEPCVCLVEPLRRVVIHAAEPVELDEAVFDSLLEGILERPTARMSNDELLVRISVVQAAFDRLLNEIEGRSLLHCSGDALIVPYNVPASRHVDTMLTRYVNPRRAEE